MNIAGESFYELGVARASGKLYRRIKNESGRRNAGEGSDESRMEKKS
jgi:hypothetical protein